MMTINPAATAIIAAAGITLALCYTAEIAAIMLMRLLTVVLVMFGIDTGGD